jgi:hypothetical protein
MHSLFIAKIVNFPYRVMWTLKQPLRIKGFCCLVIKNRTLTKENLMKKGGKRWNYVSFVMIMRLRSICSFCSH